MDEAKIKVTLYYYKIARASVFWGKQASGSVSFVYNKFMWLLFRIGSFDTLNTA